MTRVDVICRQEGCWCSISHHRMRTCDGRCGTDVRPGVNLGVTGAIEPRDECLKLWIEKINSRSKGKNQTVFLSIQTTELD